MQSYAIDCIAEGRTLFGHPYPILDMDNQFNVLLYLFRFMFYGDETKDENDQDEQVDFYFDDEDDEDETI